MFNHACEVYDLPQHCQYQYCDPCKNFWWYPCTDWRVYSIICFPIHSILWEYILFSHNVSCRLHRYSAMSNLKSNSICTLFLLHVEHTKSSSRKRYGPRNEREQQQTKPVPLRCEPPSAYYGAFAVKTKGRLIDIPLYPKNSDCFPCRASKLEWRTMLPYNRTFYIPTRGWYRRSPHIPPILRLGYLTTFHRNCRRGKKQEIYCIFIRAFSSYQYVVMVYTVAWARLLGHNRFGAVLILWRSLEMGSRSRSKHFDRLGCDDRDSEKILRPVFSHGHRLSAWCIHTNSGLHISKATIVWLNW